jgi:CubicO group peptidase (beta-lactamase class C family)
MSAVDVQIVPAQQVGMSSERLERVGRVMRGLVERGEVAGIVSLIARQGQIVHFESSGLLDLETRRPMRRDAVFRIASMTKPITAAGVMLLFEEGHFILDDPIASFIPEFGDTRVYESAPLEQPITIRHLLTHTSGLCYPVPINAPSAVGLLYEREQIFRWDEPLADKIQRLARLPLVHQPGAAWTYGMSIDVLGRLIEVVSGQALDDFLRERLFTPLNMPDTDFAVDAGSADRIAAVYTVSNNGGLERATEVFLEEPTHRPQFLMGGGGLVSTAADYARFAGMLASGGALDGVRVLGRKTVQLMMSSQMRSDQIPFVPPDWGHREGYGMALGGRTVVDVAASGLPGSAGSFTWQGAYSTDFWADPHEGIVGVVMLQRTPCWFRPGQLLRTLAYQALL